MWVESSEEQQPLRTGLTTGACATACCVAAAHYLLSSLKSSTALVPDEERFLSKQVSITLPKGKIVELVVEEYAPVLNDVVLKSNSLLRGRARSVKTTTIKDAGDDPDVTHGATVFVELGLIDNDGVSNNSSEIIFSAAEGVGTVTRDGLALAIGEPAINPVPRKMMQQHLQDVAKQYAYQGSFSVAVGIENGEAIAQKTMNPRWGILGGVSVLGTTGIVRPFSCAAWIASIFQGMDVATANGITHLVATTGNSSEDAIKNHYAQLGSPLSDMALIEMGDFAGAVLKHSKKVVVKQLTLCGGIGKISKLANGHMDLNSRVSAIDFQHMAEIAKSLGADEELLQKITQANTSVEVLQLCQKNNIPMGDTLCEQALVVAREKVPSNIVLTVWAIDRKGDFIGYADDETTQKDCTAECEGQ
jgi:cobalt-precorrin-5B (C1)-methyltransferase